MDAAGGEEVEYTRRQQVSPVEGPETLWREMSGFGDPILGPNKAWVAALAAVFP